MSPSAEVPFRVVCSQVILTRLRAWGDLAASQDRLDEYLTSLKEVMERLTNAPLTWGDPLYHLEHLALVVFRRVYRFFVIEYGVHEEKKIVFIKQWELMPGQPLQPGR